MMSEPKLDQRGEQTYAAIQSRVTMVEIPAACPPLISEVLRWLNSHGLAPSGSPFPFYRYAVFDEDHVVIDVGWPTANLLRVDDNRVRVGEFLAGRYATLLYTGPYTGLAQATQHLLNWGEKNRLQWDASGNDREWAARIERCLGISCEQWFPLQR